MAKKMWQGRFKDLDCVCVRVSKNRGRECFCDSEKGAFRWTFGEITIKELRRPKYPK